MLYGKDFRVCILENFLLGNRNQPAQMQRGFGQPEYNNQQGERKDLILK
jgi:hypothetical protein